MDRPQPEQYQPRLRWPDHVLRLVAMVVVSVATLLWVMDANPEYAYSDPRFALDLAVGLLGFVLIHLRRRWPLAIALVLTALGAWSSLITGPSWLAIMSISTRRRWVEFVPVGLLFVATATYFTVHEDVQATDALATTVLFNAGCAIGLIGWGLYIGSRRELIFTLEQRAARAESEQDLRVGQARSAERQRIAREMHDVLAHHISQISMYAGALGYRQDLSAEQMRTTAATIQDTSRRALIDLRQVLGVLRQETGEASDQPQPRFSDIPQLIRGARAAGVRVAFIDTTEQPVPDATGRAAYRIVQEAITNVAKHAPTSLVTIELGGSPEDGLDIRISNPISGEAGTETPHSGLGLLGLQERTSLLGGTFRSERDEKVFRLEGWLPWTT